MIHAVGTNLMPDMGGLRRVMPITFVTMTLGLAALVGLPPLSGFWSKEAVLGAAEETALHDGPVATWAGWLVLVTGLLTVAVTAAYATRLWLMTFFDDPRGPVAAHDASPAMRWPLVVLVVPTVAAGAGRAATRVAADVAGPVGRGQRVDTARSCTWGWPRRSSRSSRRWPGRAPSGRCGAATGRATRRCGWAACARRWRAAFYVDELYDAAFVRPVRGAAMGVLAVDDDVVDGAAWAPAGARRGWRSCIRLTQAGNVQAYLTGVLAGVVVLAVGVVTLT